MDRKPVSQQNLELARHEVKVSKPESTQGSWERISRCLSLSSGPSSSVGQSRETGGRGQSRMKPEQRVAGSRPEGKGPPASQTPSVAEGSCLLTPKVGKSVRDACPR